MTSTNWLTNDEMRVWRSFISASSAMGTAIDAALRQSNDITLDDYEVLVHLSEADDARLRMSDLSQFVLHSRSRLTQRIDRLSKRGFVSREKCDDDARGTWAVLTPDGQAAIEAAAPHHVEHVREFFFDHIDPADVPALRRSLEAVASQLRE